MGCRLVGLLGLADLDLPGIACTDLLRVGGPPQALAQREGDIGAGCAIGDAHELGGVTRVLERVGDDDGDALPRITDPIVLQREEVANLVAVGREHLLQARCIVMRHDHAHARRPRRLGDVDRRDAPRRLRREHRRRDVGLEAENVGVKVSGVDDAAHHLFAAFDAPRRAGHHGRGDHATAEEIVARSAHSRSPDAGIPSNTVDQIGHAALELTAAGSASATLRDRPTPAPDRHVSRGAGLDIQGVEQGPRTGDQRNGVGP